MSNTLRQDPEILPEFRTSVRWRRTNGRKNGKPVAFRLIASVGILGMATLSYLVLGELAVRVALHAPIFASFDFRHEHAAGTVNKAVEYDSLLGWRQKSHIKSPGFNTLDYGFRSNGDADAKAQTGGVLAVGTSFTTGSEVVDDQSWPAHLQQLTGWNVNNGGQGGYQADQIVLLAEQSLPLIRPQIVVVDLMPHTVIGTGYASSGWPKPYFSIENGELAIHNSPVPQSQTADSDRRGIKWYLGHSAALDRFMVAFFADLWFTADDSSFLTVATDEIGVTCRLLARLKQKTDASDVHLLLYLQYGGLQIVNSDRMAAASGTGMYYRVKRWIKTKLRPLLLNAPPGAPDWYEAAQEAGKCARGLGIKTVDELPVLRAVYDRNPDDLRKYYQIEPNGAMGHKSSFGNMEVAKLVAAAISEFNLAADQKSK
jgi:hypothetical protein